MNSKPLGLQFSDRTPKALQRYSTVQPNSFLFDEGLNFVIKRIDAELAKAAGKQTVLIAVYGFPNSGKSYLMQQLRKHYPDVFGFSGGFQSEEQLRSVRESEALQFKIVGQHIFASHIATFRFPDLRRAHLNDQEMLLEKVFGRPVDIKIAMSAPDQQDYIQPDYAAQYDIVIVNPKAVIKQ